VTANIKNTKAKAQQQTNYFVTTCRVSAGLSMRKIGEHLTQHIVGLNKLVWSFV